jgi:flagellar motor switch protein FliN/FliY
MSEFLTSFARLMQNNFQNALQLLLGKGVSLTIKTAKMGKAAGFLLDFVGEELIKITDEEAAVKGGFLFKKPDILAIANIMVSGEYKAEGPIREDLIDASHEFLRQLISSINVPVREYYKQKVSFEIGELETLDEKKIDELIGDFCVFIFELLIDKRTVDFIVFFESNLIDALDKVEKMNSNKSEEEVSRNVELLMDVEIPVGIKIGSAKVFLKDLLSLGPGNIIELDQAVNDPVELTVNNKAIARGEVVLADGYFGLRIKEILNKSERIKKLTD